MLTCSTTFTDYPDSLVGKAGGATCTNAIPWEGAMCGKHTGLFYDALNTSMETIESQTSRGGTGKRVLPERHAEAVEYAKSYMGTFEFMLQMKLRVTSQGFRSLSDGQVAAIARIIDREAQRQAERKQTGRDLSILPYGRTRAAVDNDSGGVTFLLIDRPDQKSQKWHGWVFVKQQQGPSEVKMGSQRPGESYVGQWPSLIDKVLDDPMAAVVRYGIELGICGVCGLPLTNDESRSKGIGPVCERKMRDA